ncbi:MAG: hypothetical protein CSB55_08670 [Candidatus Cloacimonadota bacterium]|nr:MAG: hypothetical protein CSB55_08670 [Candidatus Cloacimonadota bacterium]
MKIFFIENENPARNSSGGIMSYLVNLSKFLMNRKIKTVLAGNGNYDPDKSDKLFSEFIPVTDKEDISNYKYLFNLPKIKNKITPYSVIHVQRPDMAIPLIWSSKIKKNKIICSLHGSHDIAVFDKKGFLQGVIYFIMQTIAFMFADKLIAVDEGSRDHYLKKYPWIKNKICVIPIAVDLEKFYVKNKPELRKKFGFDKEDQILIFVGRLEKEKNVKFLIDSFYILRKSNPVIKLLLVGSGRDSEQLKNYVSENKIPDVIFWGEVSNTEIPDLLNCADVFVFGSLYEGSPTVIKEALACNLPVVSTDAGDVKSVISDIENCYISERNCDEFACKVDLALNNKNDKIRDAALKYSNENICAKTLEIYNSFKKEEK